MEQKLLVHVTGQKNPYVVEPGEDRDLATQAREILADGTTAPLPDEEGAFVVIPARVIERVEVRKPETTARPPVSSSRVRI